MGELFEVQIDGQTVLSLPCEVAAPPDVPKVSAVYLLYEKDSDRLVYIGASSDIRARLNRRHHVFDPDKHYIKIVHAETPAQRNNLEAALVGILQPPRNSMAQLHLYL